MLKTRNLVGAAFLLAALVMISSVLQDRRSRAGYGMTPDVPDDKMAPPLMVRADLLRVAVVFQTANMNPDTRARLNEANRDLMERVKTAGAEPVWQWLDVTPCDDDKECWKVSGVLDVPLKMDAAFWDRAGVVAAVTEATRAVEGSLKQKKPGPTMSSSAPELRVKDPETYRTALLGRWMERVRAFSTASKQLDGAARPVTCVPVGPIAQTRRSGEEIELTVRLDCGGVSDQWL